MSLVWNYIGYSRNLRIEYGENSSYIILLNNKSYFLEKTTLTTLSKIIGGILNKPGIQMDKISGTNLLYMKNK